MVSLVKSNKLTKEEALLKLNLTLKSKLLNCMILSWASDTFNQSRHTRKLLTRRKHSLETER